MAAGTAAPPKPIDTEREKDLPVDPAPAPAPVEPQQDRGYVILLVKDADTLTVLGTVEASSRADAWAKAKIVYPEALIPVAEGEEVEAKLVPERYYRSVLSKIEVQKPKQVVEGI